MVPFSTVQCSAPTLIHPVRSLPLNSDTHCSLGSRLALFLGVCARNNTGSASSAIILRITTGSIIKAMPKRVEARSFFRPALEEQGYLPECPRVIGGSLVWLSIQYAADRPWGASTCWT